jgi:hypothetical protein
MARPSEEAQPTRDGGRTTTENKCSAVRSRSQTSKSVATVFALPAFTVSSAKQQVEAEKGLRDFRI